MKRLLPRGYEIDNELSLGKVIVSHNNIQIYETNKNIYVLAVTGEILDFWINNFNVSKNMFIKQDCDNIFIFVSSDNYLISSLSDGPFPMSESELEAFALTYKSFITQYPNISIKGAVYIEEYSLILPIINNIDTDSNNKIIFGKWVSNGVEISADDFQRLSELVGWVDKANLYKYVELAGFELDVKEKKLFKEPNIKQEIRSRALMEKPFELPGRRELETFFNENIIDVIKNEEEYKRMGIDFPGATILYGPPGTGKTYAVERLAEYLGWEKFIINAESIASPYVHDTSKKIAQIFSHAIGMAPSILIIDEMEAYLSKRNGGYNAYHNEEMAEFLRLIPEAISKKVLIFAMTNMIDLIDSAILRMGRFDNKIEVKPANAKEINALLVNQFENLPIHKEVESMVIAKQLDGNPLSNISFILKEAGRIAVKSGKKQIDNECFEKAFTKITKKIENTSIGFRR